MTDEVWIEGDRARVIFDGSMRCGETGTVEEVRTLAAFGIVLEMDVDGEIRAWRPSEIEKVESWVAEK